MIMKKIAWMVALTLFTVFSGCAQAQVKKVAAKHKILIAYYSWSGNTRFMAQQIQQLTGGDLFEIVPVTAYTSDYDSCCAIAKEQIEAGFKPQLKGQVKDMAQYDMVIVGSPCWWGTIAPPVKSFLTSGDFKGKIVVPFMTHGGSGMGESEKDIKALCPGTTLLKGLPIYGSSVKDCRGKVEAWLKEQSIIK